MTLETLLLMIGLSIPNGFALHIFLSGFHKSKKWKPAIGCVENLRSKNVGEDIAYIPTVSYTYNEQDYSGEPSGWFAGGDFVQHGLVEIQINPEKPQEFSIKDRSYCIAIIIMLIVDLTVFWNNKQIMG